QAGSQDRRRERAENDEKGQHDQHQIVLRGTVSTSIDNYDWRRIKAAQVWGMRSAQVRDSFPLFRVDAASAPSSAMIGMPRQDRDGSVDLLHKHNADELMRPSRRAEGDGKARFFPQARRQSVGGADNEHDRGFALPSPFLQ